MMCSNAAVVLRILVVKYVISASMGTGRGTLARLLRRVPLQSVNIITVAWKILTQVSFEVPIVLKLTTIKTNYLSAGYVLSSSAGELELSFDASSNNDTGST